MLTYFIIRWMRTIKILDENLKNPHRYHVCVIQFQWNSLRMRNLMNFLHFQPFKILETIFNTQIEFDEF